jgi:hypothetical protein
MIRLNILHRTDPGERYSIFQRQQDLVHDNGLKASIFMHYFDLFDDKIVADALAYQKEFGDEIGLALHRLSGPDGLTELAHGLDHIWLFEESEKREILEKVLGKFKEVFGHMPTSVTSYHFDSTSLRILKELAPEVEAIVGGCFEEGVRVFHGCNHSWYLFNEGMPWGPWQPSKGHSLRPASSDEDWAGVVAVPHLVRDMTLAYEGRNDFWASHPPNIIRGMGNDASYCPYDLNLIDQYRMQADFNGHAYYNTFVSTQWLTWNHNSEYPPEVAWALYIKQIEYFAQLKRAGELDDLTLTDYARWHKSNRSYSEAEVYLAKEMLYNSKKHYVWYIDTDLRALVDTNQGGSIGDIRAYVGRIDGATGPDTSNRENGAYPYLVQSQYRTGVANHYADGSRTTLLVKKGSETVDLCEVETKVASLDKNSDSATLELTPAIVKFKDGSRVEIVTTYRFENGGKITLDRKASGDVQGVTATELFKGAPGKTEYPIDLHGIELLLNKGGNLSTQPYSYRRKALTQQAPDSVGARIPQVQTEVLMQPVGGSDSCLSGTARDGHIYEPYFALELTYSLEKSNTFTTCLTFKKLT